MCLLDPLSLDTPDRNDKAHEEHEGDDGEDKGEMWKICCHPEVVVSHNRRRANPAKIKEVPNPNATKCEQLEEAVPHVPQIELIYSKDAEEDGQHKRSRLRFPRGAALRISPIAVALAESQLRGPWIHTLDQVHPIPTSSVTVTPQRGSDVRIAARVQDGPICRLSQCHVLIVDQITFLCLPIPNGMPWHSEAAPLKPECTEYCNAAHNGQPEHRHFPGRGSHCGRQCRQ